MKFWRALRRRCPRCGSRDIWLRWGQLRTRCLGCGYPFEHEEGYWVGAMIVNLGMAEGLFAMVLLGGIALTWPRVAWTHPLIASGC
ncbi:MAG: hypothetical protein GEU81_00055 [Nitriliruptorales bacterium]|nr:hypothetical protein [Nitriliruptorales bacterium]